MTLTCYQSLSLQEAHSTNAATERAEGMTEAISDAEDEVEQTEGDVEDEMEASQSLALENQTGNQAVVETVAELGDEDEEEEDEDEEDEENGGSLRAAELLPSSC